MIVSFLVGAPGMPSLAQEAWSKTGSACRTSVIATERAYCRFADSVSRLYCVSEASIALFNAIRREEPAACWESLLLRAGLAPGTGLLSRTHHLLKESKRACTVTVWHALHCNTLRRIFEAVVIIPSTPSWRHLLACRGSCCQLRIDPKSGRFFLALGGLLQGLVEFGFITLQVLDDVHILAL